MEVRDKCKHLQYKGLQISAYAIGFFIGDPDAGSRKADVNMLVLSYKMSMVCRAPHGARGLKPGRLLPFRNTIRRAPHGARGLKQV